MADASSGRNRDEEQLMQALAALDRAEAQLAGYRRIARETLRWLTEDHPELVPEFRARMDALDEGGEDGGSPVS
jgi:hypothetical protein